MSGSRRHVGKRSSLTRTTPTWPPSSCATNYRFRSEPHLHRPLRAAGPHPREETGSHPGGRQPASRSERVLTDNGNPSTGWTTSATSRDPSRPVRPYHDTRRRQRRGSTAPASISGLRPTLDLRLRPSPNTSPLAPRLQQPAAPHRHPRHSIQPLHLPPQLQQLA